MNKFIAESNLHGQKFIFNPCQIVAKVLKDSEVVINGFVRMKVSEEFNADPVSESDLTRMTRDGPNLQ